MIRSLRRAHAVVWSALAIALPVGWIAGLAVRPDEALWWTARDEGARAEAGAVASLGRSLALDPALRLEARVAFAEGSASLSLRALPGFALPELLVYVAPEATLGLETPPAGARLVGSFVERETATFPLADLASDAHLLLYSLARSELVASVALGAEANSTD